jgi:hypothetical protein
MEARESKCKSSGEPREVVISVNEAEDSGITEETSNGKHWRKQNLFLQIPSRTLEVASKEFVQIKMPHNTGSTPTPTPKKSKFPN